MIKYLQLKGGKIEDLPTLRDREVVFVKGHGLVAGTPDGNLFLNQLESKLIKELAKMIDNTATELVVKDNWGIKSIKDNAFSNSNLETINLNKIEDIGKHAFYMNGQNIILTLDNTLKNVDDYAFSGMFNATVSNFPKNLQTVGISAFSGLGKNKTAFDVEFENEIDVPTSAFEEAKIKILKGDVKNLGGNAFRNLGSTCDEIDLEINGDVGSYALSGNATAMLKINSNSDIKSLGSYALQNFGASRTTPNKIVLDFRKSSFKEVPTYTFSGTSSSVAPNNFDLYLPETVEKIETYAFRYANNFRLFLSSVPTLTNSNAFGNTSNYKILIDYNLLHIITETNWSSVAANIIGYAVGSDFGIGATLPTHSKTSGKALEWYDDEAMTNRVFNVVDLDTIYFAKEVGSREMWWLEIDATATDVEVYNSDLDITYTQSSLVPVNATLELVKADPQDDYELLVLRINGVEAEVTDSFIMDKDYTIKAFSFGGTINFDFATAEPIELQIAANAGLASDYTLGATREITLKDNSKVLLRLVDNTGSNIEREDGTYAGFVIEFYDIYSKIGMNDSNTNEGGWNASRMRQTTLPAIFNLLPDEWQAVVANAKIKTMNGGNQSGVVLTTSIDKLWLPAEREIFATRGSCAQVEWDALTRFNLYEQNNTDTDRMKKYNGSNTAWWLRSTNASSSNSFVYVNSSGYVSYNGASYAYGVVPCFAI